MIVKIGFGGGFKRVGFSSSKFSPLDLFKDGKQGVWYDPSDKSTLFQDVAGTVPVTKDGDPVRLMRDKSGNSNHALAPSSAARPTYQTDGVLHWLYFDGADDCLVTSQVMPLRSFFTAATVTATNQVVFAYNIAGAQYPSGTAGGLLYCLAGGITKMWTAQSIVYPETFVQSSFVGTGINKAWFDSNPFATAATASSPELTSSHTIGVRTYAGAPANYLNGRVYGVVFTDSEVVLSSDRLQVEQYLAQKSGVTL